jgi:hypothetical protein
MLPFLSGLITSKLGFLAEGSIWYVSKDSQLYLLDFDNLKSTLICETGSVLSPIVQLTTECGIEKLIVTTQDTLIYTIDPWSKEESGKL